MSRFSYGLTPALGREVREAGGARRWFAAELRAGLADGPADACADWWPTLSRGPVWLWETTRGDNSSGFAMMCDYQRYVLARRIRGSRQVREVMTEFWEQLLNVPTNGEPSFVFRRDYGETLRRKAFTSYDEILRAAVLHPAMLVYLDNARSTASHPNENLGRELLELHTVGRGNYDEAQVKDSARILTGWAVDTMEGNPSPSWVATYEPSLHHVGPVRVLDFARDNAARDGRQLTYDYLAHLARHPETARRLAHRLATKFVRDDPPASLVAHLAKVYLDNDTRIVPVLEALVDSAEFADSVGAKVRDPSEDLVATYRVLRIALGRPNDKRDAANAMLWQSRSIGLMPFAWPRPDGAPIDNASWSTASRLLASYRIHANLGGGYYPSSGVRYRSRRSWLPATPCRFDQVVDHLSRQLLHQPATPALVRACVEATGFAGGDRITRSHAITRWGMPRVILTILDSPDHFTR